MINYWYKLFIKNIEQDRCKYKAHGGNLSPGWQWMIY